MKSGKVFCRESLIDTAIKLRGIGGALRHYTNGLGDAEEHLPGLGILVLELADDIIQASDQIQIPTKLLAKNKR